MKIGEELGTKNIISQMKAVLSQELLGNFGVTRNWQPRK